jgi:hypothetical protein
VPGGGVVIAGGFAVETDLGAGVLRTGDNSVHGVVASIDHDGRVAWDAMIETQFVRGVAVDGDDVLLVAEGRESCAWRIGPGGGEQWSFSFGGAYPSGSAWTDDGTLYVVGTFGSSDPSTGKLALQPIEGRSGWIAAIDRHGALRWAKLFEPISDRFVIGVTMSGDRVYAISSSEHDLIVDAYDRAGARVATRTLPGGDVHTTIAPLGDGVLLELPSSQLLALDRALATRWERSPGLPASAIATTRDGIFLGGATFGGFSFGDVSIPRAAKGSADAYVARLTAGGDPDWIAIGRGGGDAGTSALAASGDVVWAVGAFMDPIVFGAADPLPGERDGIQSGFAIELKQTR